MHIHIYMRMHLLQKPTTLVYKTSRNRVMRCGEREETVT